MYQFVSLYQHIYLICFYRDLSYTDISSFPTTGLRRYLKYLNLDRCKNLKTFPPARTDYDPHLCTDLTFPLLREVKFEYHALCCQFRTQKSLKRVIFRNNRCQPRTRSFLFRSAIKVEKRNADMPSPSTTLLHTSVCWSNGTIIPSTTPSIPMTSSELLSFSSTSIPVPSPTCSSLAITVTPTITQTIVCIGESLSSMTPTSTAISTTSSTPTITSTSTTSTTPTPTEPPFNCDECFDFDSCYDCIVDSCEISGCDRYMTCCEMFKKRRRRDTQTNETDTQANETIILASSSIIDSLDCSSVQVTITPSVTVSLTCFQASTFPSPSPSGITVTECESEPCSNLICSPVVQSVVTSGSVTSTVVIPSSSSSSSSSLPSPSSTLRSSSSSSINDQNTAIVGTPTCTPLRVAEGGFFEEMDEFVSCSPGNNPFNPCTDLIDSNLLRAGMWLVIILSIGGNIVVLSATLLYFISRYLKTHKKPHLMYFLYINLSVADLFMGVYLLTIAVVDLDTIGDYSRHAIEWQTSAGCRFAGFCAIFSSLLSIYTLLIITVERVYTIKFALQHKRFHKQTVTISILVGWVLTIVLCILPMVGLSSYERVGICLPFEAREIADQAYIASILVLTGIASFAIMFCYVLLFYLVACNNRSITKTLSGREELKLALRMSLLVLTDFACWAPIAFFGLTAVFQWPLINVTNSKILMVFIFPLNSCLNPILYSFSTRKFRSMALSAFNRCNVCKKCCTKKKVKQNSSDEDYSTGKSNSRRSSEDVIVNGPFSHQRQAHRRGTELSLISGFTASSRRGSTLSGGSDEGTPVVHSLIHTGRPERSSQSSLGSENSCLSEQTESVTNTSTSSLGSLKDRRFSLASLSGHVSQLTALPEEREEDLHCNKHRESAHSSSDSSNENIRLEYKPVIDDRKPPTNPPFIPLNEGTTTIYMNECIDDDDDDDDDEERQRSEKEQTIITKYNDAEGIEIQETELTFN